MADFEWDRLKSQNNKVKHGVSFRQATEIWSGIHLTFESLAKSIDGEERSITIGMIGDSVYTAIWTKRNDTIRIISVRRARNGEKKAYVKRIQERR